MKGLKRQCYEGGIRIPFIAWWPEHIKAIDSRYFRPAEVEQLLGNPARAKEKLGWEPEVKFEELVKIMVDGDLRLLDNPNYEIGF